jgi:putative ABC transport system permease protein
MKNLIVGLESLGRDVRLGLRHLAGSPGFTAAALFALTLGIGAAGSIFTVVNTVLFRSIPFEDPDRIVLLGGTLRQDQKVDEWPISYVDFRDWRSRNELLDPLVAYGEDYSFVLTDRGQPERLVSELVSADYFRLLGLRPAVGRFFTPEEDSEARQQDVVVLSQGLWKRRFGGDPSVIGRPLELNSKIYVVVGVAPSGFQGLSDKADIWIPTVAIANIDQDYLKMRRYRWLSAAGRLKPGVTVEAAQASMDEITGALAREYSESNAGIGVRVSPLRAAWFGPMRHGLSILMAGAGLILIIACINVTNLLLVRAVARQGAMAVQIALGADRSRLIRQVLVESVLLSLLGCVTGLLLAQWGTRLLVLVSGVDFRSFLRFTVDPVVVGVTVGVALLCSLGFGLAPLWASRRLDLVHLLKEESKGSPDPARQRLQSAIVVAEVALTLVLLTGAGLMIRGFQKLLATDLGFRTEGLLTLKIDFDETRYPEDPQVSAFVRQALEEVSALAGVESVAVEGPDMPSDDYWFSVSCTLEDKQSSSPEGTSPLMLHSVSPGYFDVLGASILRGRDFVASETASSPPVVVVSRAMAERHWPGQNPIGKRLKWGKRDSPEPWQTIVGVASDVEHRGLGGEERPAPDIYFSILQNPLRAPLTLNFLVRAKPGISAGSLGKAVGSAIRKIDTDLPVYDVATMEQRLDKQVAQTRFQTLLVGLFSLLALVLASIGIYGVSAYAATQRTREIAIRMALGAGRWDVIKLIVRRGAALALIGIALGASLALLVNRSLTSLIHGISAADPGVFLLAGLFLFGLVLLANYLPARRISRLDPSRSLRAE